MPKYVYYCKDCEEEFEISHSLQETIEICQLCEVSNEVVRRPSTVFLNKKRGNLEAKITPGSVMKETIEESRQELKIEQEKLGTREFKNVK